MEIIVLQEKGLARVKSPELLRATKRIAAIGDKVRKNLYEVAAVLADVDAKELYKADGFKNTAEYAQEVFKIKKTAAYTMIAVGSNYTKENRKESNLPHEEDHDFSVTQIEKMLPLKDRDLIVDLVEAGTITPDMSCREIGDVVKDLRNVGKEETTEEKTAEEAAVLSAEAGMVEIDPAEEEEAHGPDYYKHSLTLALAELWENGGFSSPEDFLNYVKAEAEATVK